MLQHAITDLRVKIEIPSIGHRLRRNRHQLHRFPQCLSNYSMISSWSIGMVEK